MSPLRERMLEDMRLAGLAEGTQQVYVTAVHQLAAHYRRSPDRLSEEEVRRYLLGLRERGVARGTFKTAQYRLQFLFRHTLGRGWGLFGGKKDRLGACCGIAGGGCADGMERVLKGWEARAKGRKAASRGPPGPFLRALPGLLGTLDRVRV